MVEQYTDEELKDRIEGFLTMSTDDVLMYFAELPNALFGGDYVYIPGTREDAILLVAHADTVWDDPPSGIIWKGNIATPYHSYVRKKKKKGRAYSQVTRGLGADDRVGVAMVDLLRDTGHGILITDDEEVGCLGAISAVQQIYQDLAKYHFAVEIDRRGDREYVFYDVSTPEFEEFIYDHFGPEWSRGEGSISDITVIGGGVGICAVNLAAGYMFEHTSSEIFFFDAWKRTYEGLCALVMRENLPRFELPNMETSSGFHAAYEMEWDNEVSAAYDQYMYEDRDTPKLQNFEEYTEDDWEDFYRRHYEQYPGELERVAETTTHTIVDTENGLVRINAAGDIVERL